MILLFLCEKQRRKNRWRTWRMIGGTMTRHETTTTQNDLWFLLFQLSLTARISLNKRFMAFVLQSMHMASYGVSACWSINRTSDSPFSNSRVSRIKGRSSNGEIVDWVTQWLTHCFTNRLRDSLTEGGPGTPPSVICRQSALFFLCSNRILWGEYKRQQCCVMWGEVLTQLLSFYPSCRHVHFTGKK